MITLASVKGIGFYRCRTEPHIIIKTVGNRFRIEFSKGILASRAPGINFLQLTNFFIANKLTSQSEFLIGSLLGTVLKYNTAFMNRLSDDLSLFNAQTHGFFKINVFSCHGCLNCNFHMPVIGSCNYNSIYLTVGKKFLVIRISPARFVIFFFIFPGINLIHFFCQFVSPVTKWIANSKYMRLV
ncbi:hypothetical protein ES708_21811 [subsurface metagenome]